MLKTVKLSTIPQNQSTITIHVIGLYLENEYKYRIFNFLALPRADIERFIMSAMKPL